MKRNIASLSHDHGEGVTFWNSEAIFHLDICSSSYVAKQHVWLLRTELMQYELVEKHDVGNRGWIPELEVELHCLMSVTLM